MRVTQDKKNGDLHLQLDTWEDIYYLSSSQAKYPDVEHASSSTSIFLPIETAKELQQKLKEILDELPEYTKTS